MAKRHRVAIIQSSYIPWRGYFDLVAQCDSLIFLDSVQFTRRDWRTRNQIKTRDKTAWLSIPVHQKGNYHAAIDEIVIADPDWTESHLNKIHLFYKEAKEFASNFPVLREIFQHSARETHLSVVNQRMTKALCEALTIKLIFHRDVDLLPREALKTMEPTQRLISLVAAAGGDEYMSGPSAKSYLREDSFHALGIQVAWMDYSQALTPYVQLGQTFDPYVSVVDPILNLGINALQRTIE